MPVFSSGIHYSLTPALLSILAIEKAAYPHQVALYVNLNSLRFLQFFFADYLVAFACYLLSPA